VEFLEIYRRSLSEFTDRVPQVGADQWDGATPCADWNVRELVNHIVYEDRWTVPLVRGAALAEVGDRFEGDLLGGDPSGAARDAAAEADEAFSEPGALERTVELSFGRTPAREYGYQLLADHLVHAWDLAAAVGADRRLDADVVRAVADWFADNEAGYRRSGAIAERVEVGPDASDQDRLIAAFGREPEWRPPA
jgi:uncharacterized protein (TIGR03086 family)